MDTYLPDAWRVVCQRQIHLSLLEILTTNAVATVCLVPTLLSKLVSELKSANATVPLAAPS